MHPNEQARAASEKTKITLGVYTVPIPGSLDLFHELHPDIEVEYIQFANFSDYLVKVPVMVAAGTAPDIVPVSYRVGVDWARQGLLYPLDDLIAQDSEFNMNDYFPDAFSAYRTEPGSYAAGKGPLYAIPTTFQAPGMMVYNINLFDEAGLAYPDTSWTWETELEALRKLTRRGADGSLTQVGMPIPSGFEAHYFQRVWQAGGEVIDADYSKARSDQPPAVSALQWLVDLVHVYGVASNEVGSFARGNVGISYEGQWQLNVGRWWNKEIVPFEWGVGPNPKHPVTGLRTFAARPDGLGISKTSKNVEAAWTYLKYRVGPIGMDAQARPRYEQGGYQAVPYIPAARELYLSAGENGVPPGYDIMLELLNDVHPNYHIGVGVDTIHSSIIPKWYQEAISGRMPVEQAAEQMTEAIDVELKRVREE